MSDAFETAPPNTRPGGDDDALRARGEKVNMAEYARTVPLWKRVHQHSLTQMFLISVQAFCGPAMSDAIAGKCFSWPLGVEKLVLTITRSWRRWFGNSADVEHCVGTTLTCAY
jgi:hypothetical protein